MAQTPAYPAASVEIKQRAIERSGERKSRPGETSPNPPSTDLPASVRLEAPYPPPIPETGDVPFFDPISGPEGALAGRSVNNTAPNLSVNMTERSINETIGEKPQAPNVIATDGTQLITNDEPDNSDHRA